MTYPYTKRDRRRERGQELVEMGVVVIILVFLTLAIVEFGRMLMIASMVTTATHDAARVAAVDKNAGGCGTVAVGTLQAIVNGQLSNVGLGSAMTVGATPSVSNGINVITVTATGNVSYIFPLAGLIGSQTVSFNRAVTFRDERC